MICTRRALAILAASALAAFGVFDAASAAPADKPAAPAKPAASASAKPAAAASSGAAPTAVSTAAKTPASTDPMRAIALAEDQRRWSDGELRGYLSHADAAIRRRAVRAVGRLQDSTSVEALAPLLADADADVRHEAAFALGQIGHRSARPALERALDQGDRALAQLGIEALGKLGDKAATPRVVVALRDNTPAMRGEAAVALWRLADSTALQPLINATNDPDTGVRWRAIYALEKIVMPDQVVLRVALQLEHPDPLVRAYAVRTLGRQKSIRGTAYLVPRIGDDQPGVAVNAIRALQLIGDTTCAPCAAAILGVLGKQDPWLRVTAATAFGDRWMWARRDTAERRRFTEALHKALGDSDAATRGAAGRALLAQVGASELPLVRPLLDDSSVYTRAAVIQGLGLLPAADAADVRELLLPRLKASQPMLERMTAAEVLGTRHDRAALTDLRAGLADTSVLYVSAIAGALAEAGDSASVRALARAYAARAADADADARISIRDALRQLAGQAFADSVERKNPARNAQPKTYAADFQTPPPVKGAILHTSRGQIEWAFDAAEAPQTVRNFVQLADRGYFNGTAFHRVVPNFVIQDGDPTGTGSGGPGYSIRCEYNTLRYDAGMVGMALSGKDTGGSQWFITHSPQPHLNGRYTIFAHVVRGMDVVNRIVQGDKIERVEILR